jgi:hypothetical protein
LAQVTKSDTTGFADGITLVFINGAGKSAA